MPVAVAADGSPVGHFEVFICGECGHAAWYAHDVPEVAERGRDVVSELRTARPCGDCGSSSFIRVAMKDITSPSPAVMTTLPDSPHASRSVMTTTVCAGCGRAEWFASAPDTMTETHHVLGDVDTPPCAWCGHSRARRIRAREMASATTDIVDRAVAIRVTLFGWKPIGKWEMRVCLGDGSLLRCGHTSWVAVDLDQLHEDRHASLSLITRPDGGGDGPYR